MSADREQENSSPGQDSDARAEPLLLTPGPLTTSARVKRAMLHDYGSRDSRFIAINRSICTRLLELVNATGSHACIPIQGSGTFAIEAMLGSLVPASGKILNLVNGAYGRRISEICCRTGRDCVVQECDEARAIDLVELERSLAGDPSISHVCVVYCETTSGLLNPLAEIATIVEAQGRELLIDAMSAFGALSLDAAKIRFAGLAASANKCLQAVPGMGFCIARKDIIDTCEGNAHSLSLDLYQQKQVMDKTGQWRFTPPVQCLLSLAEALQELEEEGGVSAREKRYRENFRILRDGMRALGFRTYLDDDVQAPIILTLRSPSHPAFNFDSFYHALRHRGFVIYPGKITRDDTFRIGCIGALDAGDMHAFIHAVQQILVALGMEDLSSMTV